MTTRGFGATAPWVVGTVTVIAAAVAAGLLVTHLKGEFTRWMTAAIAAAALLAIVWEGISALVVKPCA